MLGASAFLVGSAARMNRYVKQEMARPANTTYLPRVSLMVPCKDRDPDLAENMQMLLEQDYPHYELIFMLPNAQDPAYPILKEKVEQSPVPAQIVFGGFSQKRCQKLDNILAGLAAAADDSEVYAWVDTDARVPRHWLREMVAPLANDAVGASTTYRSYRPEKGRPITYLLHQWTAFQFSHMHLKRAVAIWGGSMVVRRDFFDTLNMPEVWDTALADDCVLHESVISSRKQVAFVPTAMTSLSSDIPQDEIVHFAMRQCVIGKVTLPAIWWISILGLSFLQLSAGIGLFEALRSGFKKERPHWSAWAKMSFWPASIVQALLVTRATRLIAAPREADDPLDSKASWALLGPFAYAFLWQSLLASVPHDTFNWRAIRYRMHHPLKTEILDFPKELIESTLKEILP